MNAIAASPAGPWVTRLGWCLVHSIWQVAVVGLAAAIALRLLRRHSAMSRYLGACRRLGDHGGATHRHLLLAWFEIRRGAAPRTARSPGVSRT